MRVGYRPRCSWMWRIAMPKTRHFPSDTHRTLMSAYAGWVARGLVGGTALSKRCVAWPTESEHQKPLTPGVYGVCAFAVHTVPSDEKDDPNMTDRAQRQGACRRST